MKQLILVKGVAEEIEWEEGEETPEEHNLRVRARVAYLDREIASKPAWGACMGAMDEERRSYGLLPECDMACIEQGWVDAECPIHGTEENPHG